MPQKPTLEDFFAEMKTSFLSRDGIYHLEQWYTVEEQPETAGEPTKLIAVCALLGEASRLVAQSPNNRTKDVITVLTKIGVNYGLWLQLPTKSIQVVMLGDQKEGEHYE